MPKFVISFLIVYVTLIYFAYCQKNEQCVKGAYPPKNRPDIPTYKVDLDLPPHQRWLDLGFHEAGRIRNILEALKDLVKSISKYSVYIINYIDNNLDKLADTLPYPYGDELKGLANVTGLPLGELIVYNLFYEVFTVCTSIVAHDEKGTLYHARNMDFGLFLGWDSKNDTWLMTELLRDATVNLDWHRSGQQVFRSVNFAGYIGVFTGFKQGRFSLTVNERFNMDGGFLGILKWFLGYRDSSWLSFITRQVMEAAQDYDEAFKWLTEKELLAPVYFILGGNKSSQACIITRSRRKAEDVWFIGAGNSSFYLLETNYDHWKNPPFFDDRRTTGRKCMDGLTSKHVGFQGLFDVLSSKPVLNQLTVYTTLMQVNSGQIESYIQYCGDPCAPW